MPFPTKTRARAHVLTLASALISSATYSAHAQTNNGNYYFFGDSATGQGNWSAIVGERGEDHAPYSSNNGFQRESNGLIWAEMMGRDVDILSDPDIDSSNINFAISGAHMTEGGDLQQFDIDTGVRVQTQFFQDLVDSGEIMVGHNDIFFVLAGGNDFLDRLEIDDPAEEIQADVINATIANVESLIGAGAKTIILSEVQPIQYAPEFADDAETRAILAALMAETNNGIFSALSQLSIPDDVNVVTQKYTDMVTYIVANSDKLGFTNTDKPCYDGNDTICAPDKENQNKYLFFDDLHFTEAGHAIEATWWQATLDGANGNASLQTGRMPRVLQYQMETYQREIRPGQHLIGSKPFVAYMRPIYGDASLKSQGNSPHTEIIHDGTLLGMEGRVNNRLILGTALSLGDVTTKFNDGGRYAIKGGGLSLYAATQIWDTQFSLKTTKGAHKIDDIIRPTGVPLLSARGETETNFWHVELAGRQVFELGAFDISTGLITAISDISVDEYMETGADGLALKFEKQDLETRSIALELRAKGPETRLLSGQLKLSPLGHVIYTRQFGDDTYHIRSLLIENTARAVNRELQAADRDHFNMSFGVEALIADTWQADLRYDLNISDEIDDDDTVTLGIRYAF